MEQVLCLVRWIAWRRQYYDITEELGVSIIQFARAIFHLVLQISTLFALLLLASPREIQTHRCILGLRPELVRNTELF